MTKKQNKKQMSKIKLFLTDSQPGYVLKTSHTLSTLLKKALKKPSIFKMVANCDERWQTAAVVRIIDQICSIFIGFMFESYGG